MIQPGFMVLQSNRLENLRRVTVEWLRRYPLKPLENEILLVQSNGISQWLKLALAADTGTVDTLDSGCGIAAAMDISLPGRFHWRAYRAVLGDLPETSPFDKPLLSWRLLRLLPSLLHDPEFAALKNFLTDDRSQRKQFQLAQRLADLLDQYQIYRADWLNDWANAVNRITRSNQPADVPAEQAWQAALWRRLLQDIPAHARHSGRAQVHQQFLDACHTLNNLNRPADLPRRVVVFGLSSLPAQTLEVLAAISHCTQVVLCVHNPCQHYWGDIVDPQQSMGLFKKPYRRQTARADFPVLNSDTNGTQTDELFMRGNPLLAAWGKQGRDYIRLLDEHDERSIYETLFQSAQLKIDVFDEPDEQHLLGQLQGDIFHLRSPQEAQQAAANAGCTSAPDPAISTDTSISFHIAHSAQREVEILQDHLLQLFNQDAALRPRDVLVMVPDINQFAPAVQAVFGRLDYQDKRFIPFTISDQGKRHQAPVLKALEMLLQLPSARLGVSELLDFLDIGAVQKAFGFSADDKPLLHRWIEQAGIRWGLNAAHRASLGMSEVDNNTALEQNTWHFGLRRMLLGYAIGRGQHGDASQWQDIEAFDEVGGLSAALVGKLAHLLRQLEQTWTVMRKPATVPDWTLRLSLLLSQYFVADGDEDLLRVSRVEKMLRDWRDACTEASFTDELSIDVVREFVLEQLDVQPLTQRFLAGSVNFATLMPMRAIPFKHICLLGMNDGDYPRQVPAVDFDLMRHDYRPGDRSRRDDDRYLFLEALLSARQSLYISWTGRSIRDNSERAPSVLVAQLRDYLATTHNPALIKSLTRAYPLQPFSSRYFDAASEFYTYAAEWSQAGQTPRTLQTHTHQLEPDQFQAPQIQQAGAQFQYTGAQQTQALNVRHIGLSDLEKLMRVPAEVFFEQSLGVVFSAENVTAEDHEMFAVNGLANWSIQQQLIKDAVAAIAANKASATAIDIADLLLRLMGKQQRSGNLPITPFADSYATKTLQRLRKPLQIFCDLLGNYPEKQSLRVLLDSTDKQVTLSDQISDGWQQPGNPEKRIRCVLLNSQLWDGKDGKQTSVKWHYLARLWPAHLAAQLHGPVTTHILGPDTNEVLAALDPAEAQQQLTSLINLWQQNLVSPLAASVKTSCAMLTTPDDKSPRTVACNLYNGVYQVTGEVQAHYALSRLWPDIEDLYRGGFDDDSDQLYGNLTEHWLRHREKNVPTTADTGDQT